VASDGKRLAYVLSPGNFGELTQGWSAASESGGPLMVLFGNPHPLLRASPHLLAPVPHRSMPAVALVAGCGRALVPQLRVALGRG
jgi:hypothetical protein